jgi:hypothetical protein
MNRIKSTLRPLQLDPMLTLRDALERVLRLPSVASKRYLTNKVSFVIWAYTCLWIIHNETFPCPLKINTADLHLFPMK